MKMFVQWSLANPADWQEIDSADWRFLPDLGKPDPVSEAGGAPGWIHCINIMGTYFYADYYALEELGNGAVRVYTFNEKGSPSGHVVDIYPLQPDAKEGGAYNTKYIHTLYTDDHIGPRENAIVEPLDKLPLPPEELKRYGVPLPEKLHDDHNVIQTMHGWREWTAGVPIELVQDGRLVSQRSLGRYVKPDGTRTYYQNTAYLSFSAHTAEVKDSLTLARGVPASSSSPYTSYFDDTGLMVWAFIGPTNEPDQAAWPTGNYRARIDISTGDADASTGYRTMGTSSIAGHFCRANSTGGSHVDGKEQTESAFVALSGLYLATTGSVDFSGSTKTDRFGLLLAAYRSSGSGTHRFSIQLNELDDWVDGPWVPAFRAMSFGACF